MNKPTDAQQLWLQQSLDLYRQERAKEQRQAEEEERRRRHECFSLSLPRLKERLSQMGIPLEAVEFKPSRAGIAMAVFANGVTVVTNGNQIGVQVWDDGVGGNVSICYDLKALIGHFDMLAKNVIPDESERIGDVEFHHVDIEA